MAELHYFPMYASDWLAGHATTLMTLEQEGAFLRLLLHSWLSASAVPCSVPDDDTALASLSKMGKRWKTAGAFVRAQFETIPEYPGHLRNPKLWAVYVAQMEKHSKRVIAGALGGNAKAKRKQKSSNASGLLEQKASKPARAMRYQSESESELKTETTKTTIAAAVASAPASELWPPADCEALRKKWESIGRSCEYPKFRKTLKPLFVPTKRYTHEQLTKAIDGFDELAKLDGPMKSSFWHLQRFVDHIGEYVTWGAMEATDDKGNLTARGKQIMGMAS